MNSTVRRWRSKLQYKRKRISLGVRRLIRCFFELGFVRRQFLSTTRDFYSCGQALSRFGVTIVCRSIRLNAAQLPRGDQCTPSFSGLHFVTCMPTLLYPREPDMQCTELRLSGRYFPSSECRSNNGDHSNVNLNLIGHTIYIVFRYTDNKCKCK